jgi:hypothetical protein
MRPMTLISSQLRTLPTTLRGEWVRRWNRNLWDGRVSCSEAFVILLIVRLQTRLLWAKSLPSKNNTLELKLDIFPVSQTEPHFQLLFSSGTGAFIQGVTAKLPDREHTLSIKAPETFDTGFVLPFTQVDFVESLEFSFACFAKTDVVVRRGYVWGLKPHFLGDLASPWDEILARGRNGAASLKAAG